MIGEAVGVAGPVGGAALERVAGDGALVALDRASPASPVLIVACLADEASRPHYGVFTRRQIEAIRALGVRCDVLSIAGYRTPWAYARAAGLLARLSRSGAERWGLVHAHGGETAIAASAYRRAQLLTSYLGSDLQGAPDARGRNPPAFRLRNAAIRAHARLNSATITKAAVMAPALPAARRERNHVIPNGVALDHFRPRDRTGARQAMGFGERERIVLFAADPATPLKGYPLAQATCERAAKTCRGVRLHVAHGVSPQRMPELMNAADCLLHPAMVEGSPNVIKEALACNLPIVATGVGDIPERLAGVRDCHVCPPHADALAAAVIACVDPPRRSDGRAAVRWLDDASVARRVVAVYEQLIGDAVWR